MFYSRRKGYDEEDDTYSPATRISLVLWFPSWKQVSKACRYKSSRSEAAKSACASHATAPAESFTYDNRPADLPAAVHPLAPARCSLPPLQRLLGPLRVYLPTVTLRQSRLPAS